MGSKITAPSHLGAAGTTLWNGVASKYTLRPDELARLEDACRLTDMIEALSAAWAEDGKPMTTKGSMGQLVIHPLIDKLADHRMKRAALLAGLKLPDDPSVEGGARTNQQREAAQSRWAAAHGAGA